MPILTILLLATTCLPVPWPRASEVLSTWDCTAITIYFVVFSASVSLFASLRVARLAAIDRWAAAARYNRLRRNWNRVNLVGCAALILLGWGWAVNHLAADAEGTLAPFGELLVPAPYLALTILNWGIWFFAERGLHRARDRRPEFYSWSGYILQQSRQFLLVVFLPVFVIAAQQSVARYWPVLAGSPAYQLSLLLGAFGLMLLLPLAIKPLLGLKRLPGGAIRDRLDATAAKLNFRCRDWLLWPTRGQVANAMIVGVIPQARFVVFTDRLLESLEPDELEAVVGHEIGHARHGHMPYYFGFFALSSLLGGTAYAVFEQSSLATGPLADFGLVGAMAGLGAYLFFVFGFLSRVCERQADINGVRAASADPAVIDPAGIRAMVRALDSVMQWNGLDRADRGSLRQWIFAWWKSWQHGPPSHRIDFLLTLVDHPERAARHDRIAFRVRIGLMALLLGALGGTVVLLGWDAFVRML